MSRWRTFAASPYNGRWFSLHSFLHRWLLTDLPSRTEPATRGEEE